MPERIQLRRTKGWRKPDGAIVVARPSKWGNRFSEMQIGCAYPSLNEDQAHSMAVAQFRDIAGRDRDITLYQRVVGGHGERERVTYTYPPLAEIVGELGGHDLACWCELDEPCHADVLLELANAVPCKHCDDLIARSPRAGGDYLHIQAGTHRCAVDPYGYHAEPAGAPCRSDGPNRVTDMACSHPGCTCNGKPNLGRCPCGGWPLYIGAYDRHGTTARCSGCLKIPAECTCRRY